MKNQYARYYNENALLAKIRDFSLKAGQKVMYPVLILYYVLKSPQVNVKTKLTIAAALGYFILPADMIFDLTPILGFSDDLGVLIFTLIRISSAVTPEIKQLARKKMGELFKTIDDKQLNAIEKKYAGKSAGS